jgi:O-antigen/teichoic acid export membrane protein
MAGAFFAGLPVDAVTAMILAGLSIWVSSIAQMIVLNYRLKTQVEPGEKAYDVRGWFAVALPIIMVEGFYLVLAHTDILVLQHFRSPTDVAIYYAAAKTLALVAFIYFAIAAMVPHRFSALHVAGDRAGIAKMLRQSTQWVFWPSVAATIALLLVGQYVLRLFGPNFDQGYHLMFILAIGLLARASIGPVERLLNMLGEQRICAAIYCVAFLINLVLCLLLIPSLGPAGAAISTATAMVVETATLFYVTRKRLGFHAFIFGHGKD